MMTVVTQNRGAPFQTVYQDFGHERIPIEEVDEVVQDSEMVDTNAEFEIDTVMTQDGNIFRTQNNQEQTLQTPSFPTTKKHADCEETVSDFNQAKQDSP